MAGCGFSIGTAFLAWVFRCIYTRAILFSYLLGRFLRRYIRRFGEEFLLSHNITIESRKYVQLLLMYHSLAFAWLRCCVQGVSSPCAIGVSDLSVPVLTVDWFFVFLSFVDFFLSQRTSYPRSLYIHLPVTRDRCWKWFWRERGGPNSRSSIFCFSFFFFTWLEFPLSCFVPVLGSVSYDLPLLV